MVFTLFLNWLGVEILNYNSYTRIRNHVEQKRVHHSENIDSEWMENFWINELSKDELIQWIQNSISKKYNPNILVQLDDIPQNKMLKWTAYNLYFQSISKISEEQLENSRNVLRKIEEKIGHQFGEDGDPDIYFLKFGTNNIVSNYRPILIQPIIQAIKKVAYGVLKVENFQKLRTQKASVLYFYHNNPNSSKTVMFIHGLGFGITPYLSFIKNLKENNSVIALVLPNISNMDFHTSYNNFEDTHLFPSYNEWRDDIKHILIKHNVDKFDIIGHSFGTIIMGIMLNDSWIEPKIDKKIFVDPVCFIDDSYKIYKYLDNPNHGNSDGIVNDVFNLLIYRDIYVKYATQRFIYGPEFWIFDYDKLSSTNNLVILSKKDQMVPIDSLHKRLIKHNIPCLMVYGAYHAEIFTSKEYKHVLQSVNHFISNE